LAQHLRYCAPAIAASASKKEAAASDIKKTTSSVSPVSKSKK
jgi:hypothetical protein